MLLLLCVCGWRLVLVVCVCFCCVGWGMVYWDVWCCVVGWLVWLCVVLSCRVVWLMWRVVNCLDLVDCVLFVWWLLWIVGWYWYGLVFWVRCVWCWVVVGFCLDCFCGGFYWLGRWRIVVVLLICVLLLIVIGCVSDVLVDLVFCC